MANLITITDIQAFKPLSSNMDATKKVDPFIKEAQIFDLRPIIGDEFFISLEADVLGSPALTIYEDLWNGSNFTVGNNTYINYGLKAVLCYYAYARIEARQNTNQTAFGVVQKTNPNSTAISEKQLAKLVGQSISGAKLYEENVKFFLRNNASTYPLYKCDYDNKRTRGIRITPVR